MRCCVPSCSKTSENISQSDGVTFHNFPSEVHLRAAWLRALGKQDGHLPGSAVVCSQHFLSDDIYETERGRQIVTGAVPSTVQVCMICLDTDSKMFLLSKHRLEEAYEKLTGHPLSDPGNLKQTVCVQCAQRLTNFSRFRDKSLRAHALMMDLVEKHELITRQHIKMINRSKHQLKSNMVLTTLGPDHCDLHILEHSSEDKQTELEETGHGVVVKTEGSDDSMSVDEDTGVINEEDNNVDDLVQDPLKCESAPFQCTLCVEEFVHKHAYMQHMRMHLQDGAGDGECATSQVCKPHTAVSSSSSHSSLITVVNRIKNIAAVTNEVKIEKCDVSKNCDPNFPKSYIKNQFKNSPQNCSEKKLFACDICSSTFESRSLIVTHIKNRCTEKLFSCALCEYKFKQHCHLVSHMRTHTGEKPFTCKICNKKFAVSSSVVRHMKIHTREKPFSCTICNNKFAVSRSLVTHMRSHTGEKPFTCKICNKKFAFNVYLVTHMRTHTGEKPFSCKICNARFTRKSDLVPHVRIHTGEKPFICKICNSKFVCRSGLVRHMRSHTGEKPFSCKICNAKFTQNSNLVKHVRTHTGEKPFTCILCDYKCSVKSTLARHMGTHR